MFNSKAAGKRRRRADFAPAQVACRSAPPSGPDRSRNPNR
jgi:hypothetical protein